jgi:hypothetical protein
LNCKLQAFEQDFVWHGPFEIESLSHGTRGGEQRVNLVEIKVHASHCGS